MLFLFILVGLIVFYLRRRRKRLDLLRNSTMSMEAVCSSSVGTDNSSLANPHGIVRDTCQFTVISNIKVLDRIGEGHFGEVSLGKWNETIDVALKQLKSAEYFEEFVKEVSMLQSLNHPNIVRFYGIHSSLDGKKYLVMEYIRKGSLDVVLQMERGNLTRTELLSFAKDAASGMLYLSEKGIAHRDLALRNLLVAENDTSGAKYIVKISDFGMARSVVRGYYKTESKTIPVRWCSPEALEYGKFSIHSDVWAFGVVLWEIFSYGKIPYVGMSNMEVVENVLKGYRLSPPENCPKEIYELMVACWNHEIERRPNFDQVLVTVNNLLIQANQQPSLSRAQQYNNDSYPIYVRS